MGGNMDEKMREKLINALLYAMEEYPDIGRTKLMKFVFFNDLIHFTNYGTTLLDDEYQAKQAGPVPLHAFTISDSTQPQFEVCNEQIDEERIKYSYYPRKKCNREIFTEEEKENFDKVLRVLKAYNTAEISDITHRMSHRMSLWKKHEGINNDPIRIDEFKLDDSELYEFFSVIDYQEAIWYAELFEIHEYTEDNDPVPPEYIKIQSQTLIGE